MAAPVSSLPLAASLTPEPVSPAQSDNSNNANQAQTGAGPVRRKTSRRANTAERRATHNAVERQRRETLNGRFLVSVCFPGGVERSRAAASLIQC
ncbi:hypothetical protein EXIGLDRAFT_618411 [Exidia glandulosa HHB12029]|uniref:BHLH domain-containing protein n=1 Tax=Exidia glandulosa HHB12029 TaxID=1314781 RepID=A0A166A7H6_EXIGL|nr:hypothetical protein EXIGLDRAFT_618411 [Exidia glandulosa HHB12029]